MLCSIVSAVLVGCNEGFTLCNRHRLIEFELRDRDQSFMGKSATIELPRRPFDFSLISWDSLILHLLEDG